MTEIKNGSAFEFLKLGVALKNQGLDVRQSHIDTLVAYLDARGDSVSPYTSRAHQVEGGYRSPLDGPPLFCALYAFAQALKCKPYAEPARERLEEWLDGDDRAVAYNMICLKWEADSLSAPAVYDSEDGSAETEDPHATESEGPVATAEALADKAESLRSDDPEERRSVLQILSGTARMDGAPLAAALPCIADALAGEDRDRLLAVLTTAIPKGLDVAPIMPVLAGLLLDRDYYDAETVGRLYACLTAAAEAGADISLAWPFLPLSMVERERKLMLLKAGAKQGLSLSPMANALLGYLQIPLPTDGRRNKATTSNDLDRAAIALDTLALGVERGDFTEKQIDRSTS
jgi:hypothetical protein